MANYFVCFCLVRLVLPACLGISVLFRQNVLSLIYLLLLLYLPIVKVPTEKTMAGATGRYLRAVMVLSLLPTIAQLSFQIVLLSMPPYAGFLKVCEPLEKILRHIGFVRLDKADWLNIVINVGPEVVMLVSSIVTYALAQKFSKRSNLSRTSSISAHSGSAMIPSGGSAISAHKNHSFSIAVGKYLSLALLCLAGVMRPSILSGVYFIIFLGAMTWWGSYRSLGRPFAVVLRLTCVLAAVHLLLLFAMQTQWIQELTGPNCNYCRYLGLTVLFNRTSCDSALAWEFTALDWSTYLNPIVIMWLYYIAVLESRLLMKPPGGCSDEDNPDCITESTPLMRSMSPTRVGFSSSRRPSSLHQSATIFQDPLGSVTITDHHDELIQLTAMDTKDSNEASGLTVWDHLINGTVAIIQMVNKSSYIGTNIIMMAWSITYHSWITFVLLLWASLLWMVPNQRRAMLRCSPYLVCYAMMLLIAQYIYSMDLTEQELPQEVKGVNLRQIGFEKPEKLPCKQLLAKCLYTIMFWLTLRQYMQEKMEHRRSSALEDMVAPLAITVTTATRGFSEQMEQAPSAFMTKVGNFLKNILTQYWIWVVAIMLFVIGITGNRMTVLRIIYMALFLIFILTFQLSYHVWRKMLFAFWITVIVYSMTILVTVYTYQFDHFPDYWERFLGIPLDLQLDIGLEKFETGQLFVRLLTPTFFLIITVVQLHYFHKDFLEVSDITYRRASTRTRESSMYRSDGSSAAATREMEEIEKEVEQNINKQREVFPTVPSLRQLRHISSHDFKLLAKYWLSKVRDFLELCWLFLELHILKIMLLAIMFLSIYDVCAIHFSLLLLAVVALLFNSKIHVIACHICVVIISLLFLAKMIYQIDYIRHDKYSTNCTEETASGNETLIKDGTPDLKIQNFTVNTADWLGFQKTSNTESLSSLVKGYIGILLVGTIMALVDVRQKYKRHLEGRFLGRPHSMFPFIKRADAEKDLISCIKYLFNYGYYKFGLEICLMATVALIGIRMDMYAVFYSLWLCFLCMMTRETVAKVWIFFQTFIVVMTPLQYAMAIGLPPAMCIDYPWHKGEIWRRMQDWMFLPDSEHPPSAAKLACDFFLLILVCRQSLVFRIERRHDNVEYPGGTNKDVTSTFDDPSFVNPLPDFISYVRSWLDILKRGILSALMWVTLAIVFLAGTNRVNVFSVGYLVGSFIFLWQGEDFYLRPIKMILHWWNLLLGYNVFVITTKTVLQIAGCIFVREVQDNACWFMQLFSIACIKKFPLSPVSESGIPDPQECSVNRADVGLVWDGICFGFLVMMRRLFCSYYFMHLVDETKAMTILASRGAELIEELSEKQIKEQQEEESNILDKIKQKMDRIKATQKKSVKEPTSHYTDDGVVEIRRRRPLFNREAIRSGDYYMFEELEDDDLEDKKSSDKDAEAEMEGHTGARRVTLGKLFETAMKTDVEQAATLALTSGMPEGSAARTSLESQPAVPQQMPSPAGSKTSSARVPTVEEMDEDETGSLAPPSAAGSRRHSGFGSEAEEMEIHTMAEEPPKQPSIWQKLWTYLKFAWAFVESAMVSLTKILNRSSRDYRYVVRVLTMEKKMLKDKETFGLGIRTGSSMIWQPLPESTLDRSRISGNAASLNDLDLEEMSEVDQPPVVRLLLALWYAIISHSDIVCYFLVFLNQIKSATILSLPLPLMVFLWGTLTVPRPTKTFWVTIIAYTEVIVIVKCMFQFEMLPWNQSVFMEAKMPFYPPRIIGIERKPNYAVYDLLLLLVVFFHRFMLKSLGLWKSTYDDPMIFDPEVDEKFLMEFEDQPKGPSDTNVALKKDDSERYRNRSKDEVDSGPGSPAIQSGTSQAEEQPPGVLTKPGLRRRSSEIKELEHRLKDMHPGSQLMVRPVDSDHRIGKRLKFNEPDVEAETSRDVEDAEDKREVIVLHAEREEVAPHLPGVVKQVVEKYLESVHRFFEQLLSPFIRVTVDVYAYMFICDFFNFMVVIFGFAAFGNQQGDGGVSAYLEENKVPIPFLVMLILQFALIIIDRALFLRKFILGKIMFQFILVVGVHVWMFFILPYVTDKQFNAALPPQMWYMVKCFYLLLSAYQIRCGYPTRILGNFLCKKYNIINMVLFKAFMIVPFLFELRALMDWIWTDTSMTLFDWLKMEDIFAHIFQLKCARRMEEEYPQPRGEKKAPYIKYLMGGGILFLLIGIIWFPLVLFALGNTVGKPNLPTDVSLSLKIGPYEPIYKMAAQGSTIFKMSEQQFRAFSDVYKKDRSATTFLSNYDFNDVAVIQLNGNSTSVWGISPPDKDRLIRELNSSAVITIKMTWEVSRFSNNPAVPPHIIESKEFELGPIANDGYPYRKNLLNMLLGGPDQEPVILPGILPKFIKVTNRGKAAPAKQLMDMFTNNESDKEYRNVSLQLSHVNSSLPNAPYWWGVTENCTDTIFARMLIKLPFADCSNLLIYTFNDKLFPATLSIISGGGIVGLYLGLVLVFARTIRSLFFTGVSFRIMFDELPYVDRIVQLCLDIYLVRESGELDLEEDLFAKLVFLYRSPETLIKWTRPREDEEGGDDQPMLAAE